jgi:PhnB protein
MQINPYLTFNGDCKEAFEYYAQVLNGKIDAMIPHEGTPAEAHAPAGWGSKILHARLTAGESAFMGSDVPPSHYQKPGGVSVSLGIQDPAEAQRVFQALAEGGTTQMPIQKTFWAQLFGMCVDSYGIPWMVNCV